MKKIDQMLTDYDQYDSLTRGIDNLIASEYMLLNRQQLGDLTKEELKEASYFLAQYAYQIQLEHNKHFAISGWCDHNIKITIANDTIQYSSYSFEERRMSAIKNNDYANKLYILYGHAKFRADKLYFISEKVKFISTTIGNMLWVDRKQS